MFFKKLKETKNDEAVVKRGIKKMDAVITGAILGGVVAGVYGVKKMKNSSEKNKIISTEDQNSEKNGLEMEKNSQKIEINDILEKTEEKIEKKWFFAKIFK